MKKLLFTVAIAALTAGAAGAQTIFDGGYYGLGLGYGAGDVTNFDATNNLGINGPVGSLYAGWNWSSGNTVYGVEADVSFGKIEGAAPCFNPAWTCDANVKTVGTLRGRLGVASGNTLFYATAGAAAGRVTLTTIDAALNQFPDTQTATGWVGGVGLEGQMGGSPWRYRGEILYHDLGTDTYQTDVPYTAGTTFTVVRFGMVMPF